MSTSENKVEIVDRGHKEEEKEEGKDFIHDSDVEPIFFHEPTADVPAITIHKINLERADIVVYVRVNNPNIFPTNPIDIHYLVDGRKLVSGEILGAGTIGSFEEEIFEIPLTLNYDDIKSTDDDVSPGISMIIPYRIYFTLFVCIPIFGSATLRLENRGEIRIPKKPDVEIEMIKLQKFSLEETVAILHVRFENMNDFDLGVNDLDCEVWLCDSSIGGADISFSIKLDKNGSGLVNVPITFRLLDFYGSALWYKIRGKRIGYTIKGNVDVDTPFGALRLPIIKEGGETRLKKEDDDDDDDDDDEE